MLPAFDATPDGKYAPGKKVALVGATGVGKTTTVAKIAADARIRRGCDVAMITTDAYRIGAFEQLQLYAETIQAPLRLVSDEEGMKEAVAAFSGVDLLLIDTQGVSPHDTDGLGRLKSMLDAVGDGETHLVLAGNAADAALHDALRRFASLGVDHLIFSKLDEAVGLGVILNCLSRVNAKLSFVTNGQRVPNDLQAPRGRDVASWVVSGMSRL
jgi:flagellar biosynthesis protein FlhF